jgi:hypothetical protein
MVSYRLSAYLGKRNDLFDLLMTGQAKNHWTEKNKRKKGSTIGETIIKFN